MSYFWPNIVKNGHESPTNEEIIAENLVKIRNIRENFSKRGDFICLFAKISVPLQRI